MENRKKNKPYRIFVALYEGLRVDTIYLEK